MFGCRTAVRVGCSVLAFGLAVACGGAVEHNDGAAGGSPGSAAGKAGASSTGSVGRGGSALGEPAGGGPDTDLVDPEPVESGCPVEELPPPDLECDAFTAGSCGPDAGCYPFVDHPEGSGCDQQHYGTVCLAAGRGTQGMLCGEATGDWCGEGFVCVVGQRAGKRCAALCKLGAANSCSGGLICGDLDVAGFGVCG